MRIIIDTTPEFGTASRRASREYALQRQREGMAYAEHEKRVRAEFRAKLEREKAEKEQEKKSNEG